MWRTPTFLIPFSALKLEVGMATGVAEKVEAKHRAFGLTDEPVKYTSAQDKLIPLYEAQLNGYALIGAERGLQPVVGLALIYMEPVTHNDAAKDDKNLRDDGFAMGLAGWTRVMYF